MKKALNLKGQERLFDILCQGQRALKLLMLVVLCIVAVNQSAFAQSKQITGTVTDEAGVALPGVAVMVKGTTIGIVTDFDGKFTLSKVPEEGALVVSFIGMVNQEIPVAGKTNFDIILKENSIGLEEVVTIGYVTRKKGEVSGSVSTIDSEELGNTSTSDLAKSLSGKVPGLIVSDRGGYPGETDNMSMLIRGKATLGNSKPLILIDGISAPTFSHLAPQDIESLTILKDGAAAIYGARAANGVILITTKRGKSGKPTINLSSTYNISSFSAKPKMMNSAQYATYANEITDRQGQEHDYSEEDIKKFAAGNDPNYPSTNWMDETFSDYSPELRTSLSISGGSDDVKYFVSGDYIDQTGMYKSGDLNFTQAQVRSNLDIKVFDNFTLGVDLSGRFGDRNQPGVNASYIFKHIYTNKPTDLAHYDNGLPAWGGENGANPAVMSSSESGFVNKKDNDLRGKFSFNWDLDNVITGLSAKGFAGYTKKSYDEKSWYTPWTYYTHSDGKYSPNVGYSQRGPQRILTESFWKYDELMLNATVHYSRTFNDKHTVRGFAGLEQFTSETREFSATRKGFPTTEHTDLFAGSDGEQTSTGVSEESARVNYFGSVSYDYEKRYFVDATLRRDGSGNFADGKQFGTFPSVAVAWSIADEKFMDFTNSWLDNFKVRASWALMGNDRIDAFQHLTRYAYGLTKKSNGNFDYNTPNTYIFGIDGKRYNGYESSTTPNPDVTWEKAETKNIGVNFTVLDRRLTADVNYFFQKRTDILTERAAEIPEFAGLDLPDENLGEVNNYGWEFQVDWSDKIGKVNYNLGANFTNAKNEIVYMAEAAGVTSWMKQEGHPLDSYIVYPTAGIFRDQAQVDATKVKKEGVTEGEPIYLDTNEDGEINELDRVRKYTSNIPQIQYGIYGGLQYKNWDFNFLFQGQAEAEMLVFFDQDGAKPDFVFNDRWTPENRNASMPRAFEQGNAISGNQNSDANKFQGADFYLKDASFLRLKQIDLGYTFSKDQIGFGDLKLFFRGYNLLTLFSDVYDMGLDPEANGYNNFRNSTYPSLKTYTFGLNVTF